MKNLYFCYVIVLGFLSNTAHSWVYIPDAPTCNDWIRPNFQDVTEFSSRQDGAGNWLLLCRGRSKLEVTLTTGITPNPSYGVLFDRSGTAAGSRGEYLSPGQCAWPDRGLMESEPNQIYIDVLCNPVVTSHPVRSIEAGFTGIMAGVKIMATPLSFMTDENRIYGIFVSNPFGSSWQAKINKIKGSPIYSKPRN